MAKNAGVIPTYLLLLAAVLALWPGTDRSDPLWRRYGWVVLAFAATFSGLAGGQVNLAGLAISALFGAIVATSAISPERAWRTWLLKIGVVLLAAGLMVHQLPGFHNVAVLSGTKLSMDAVPYSLYLNFDKTLVGLFIVGFTQTRIRRWREALQAAAASWLPALGTIGLLMALSLTFGYVRFEPKLPSWTWLWLIVNLFSTCLAEEGFFRGFVQKQLTEAWSGHKAGAAAAIAVASLLFGLAHIGGGRDYVLLATLAGLGYGWVYHRTGRIEASMLTHVSLNTVHLLLFTYPRLAQ